MKIKIRKTLLISLIFLLIINIYSSVTSAGKPVSLELAASAGVLQVHYLDVGHGDSIYIKTAAGDDILIDGGYALPNNNYENEVVDYLSALKVDDIEVMISTHPHRDHFCGLIGVLDRFEVESIYAPNTSSTVVEYQDFLDAIEAEGLTPIIPKIGVDILPADDAVTAIFVGPANGLPEIGQPIGEYLDANPSSLVFHLSYENNSFLFTGDSLIQSEVDMIANMNHGGPSLSADVLKIGHHGQEDATSAAFLDAVAPGYAVISASSDDPDASVIALLDEPDRGITTYTTYEYKNILATSDGQTITFTTNFSVAPHDATLIDLQVDGTHLTDIADHWAKLQILELIKTNVISGYPDKTFKPDQNITRAEFAALLVKALDLKAEGQRQFEDMRTTHWARDTVTIVASKGIVSGFDDGTFRPDQFITREQMAIMINRAVALPVQVKHQAFGDSNLISEWAVADVQNIVDNHIMSGFPDGSLKPQAFATRAEAVTIILKVME